MASLSLKIARIFSSSPKLSISYCGPTPFEKATEDKTLQ
jgi:hypothetical protein